MTGERQPPSLLEHGEPGARCSATWVDSPCHVSHVIFGAQGLSVHWSADALDSALFLGALGGADSRARNRLRGNGRAEGRGAAAATRRLVMDTAPAHIVVVSRLSAMEWDVLSAAATGLFAGRIGAGPRGTYPGLDDGLEMPRPRIRASEAVAKKRGRGRARHADRGRATRRGGGGGGQDRQAVRGNRIRQSRPPSVRGRDSCGMVTRERPSWLAARGCWTCAAAPTGALLAGCGGWTASRAGTSLGLGRGDGGARPWQLASLHLGHGLGIIPSTRHARTAREARKGRGWAVWARRRRELNEAKTVGG